MLISLSFQPRSLIATRRFLTGWFIILIALVLLPACDSFPAAKSIGVTLERGTPTVLYIACAGERVSTVQIVDQHGDSPWDGDDEVLWRISSSQAVNSTSGFAIGVVPEGFREDQELEDPLPPGMEVVAMVRTGDGIRVAVPFQVDDLRSGEVVTAYEDVELAEEDFKDQAREEC